MKKVGIIGVGMVGGATRKWFEKQGNKPFLYDKYKKIGSKTEINKADYIFICVPTPFVEGKGYDNSIVEEALGYIEKPIAGFKEKVVIIKSTILPGTTEALQKQFPYLKLMHNPEFLTEVTADQDMAYPDRQIIGYTHKSYTETENVMRMLPLAPFEKIVPAHISEFVKYYTNTWFATKVAKNNEMYDIFKKFGGTDKEFEDITECSAADKRIGPSHLQIFHKGYRGYGGACLPKDVKSLIEFANTLGIEASIIKEVDKYNEKLNPYR